MRINRNNIKTGYATSVSYSPLDSDIHSWCEPRIKPFIQALLDKNYMTISSCDGHSISDDTYVYIAFGNMVQAHKFIEETKVLWQFGISFGLTAAEEYMEQTEDLTESFKDIPALRKKGVSVRNKMSRTEAADCINKMYKRGYDRYWVVRLTVSKGADRVGFWKALYNYYYNRKKNIKIATEFAKNKLSFYEG